MSIKDWLSGITDEMEQYVVKFQAKKKTSSIHPYWQDWQLEQHRRNGGCPQCNWGSAIYD